MRHVCSVMASLPRNQAKKHIYSRGMKKGRKKHLDSKSDLLLLLLLSSISMTNRKWCQIMLSASAQCSQFNPVNKLRVTLHNCNIPVQLTVLKPESSSAVGTVGLICLAIERLDQQFLRSWWIKAFLRWKFSESTSKKYYQSSCNRKAVWFNKGRHSNFTKETLCQSAVIARSTLHLN